MDTGSDVTASDAILPPNEPERGVVPKDKRAPKRQEGSRRRDKARQILVRPDGGRDLDLPTLESRSLDEVRFFEAHVAQFPTVRRGLSRSTWITFILFVICPTIIGAVYYLAIASDQFAGEFKFAVTDAGSSSSAASAMSGVAAMLGSSMGATSTMTSNYMVTDYIRSSQAIKELQARIGLIGRYSRPSIDFLSRYTLGAAADKFLPYWKGMVRSDYDQVTGLAVVEVRAFSADDALLIANTLVSLAEDLVNDIARRPLIDSVHVAEQEVVRTQEKLKSLRTQLTAYRNSEAVIDPVSGLLTANNLVTQNLRQAISSAQTDLDALNSQHISPDSPASASFAHADCRS